MGRATHSAARVAPAALALALGGCLYLDDINERPTAEIFRVDETAPLYLGSVLELTANKSRDPDGDRLVYAWTARRCTSMTSCGPEFEQRMSGDPTFTITVPSKQLIAVELIVTDEHGAVADDSEFYAVDNRPPTVRLQVQGYQSPTGGFTVGRPIELFAEGEDEDGDGLGYAWTLFPAGGSVPDDLEWTELSATHYRLRPDVPGLWHVSVTVDDGDGGTDEAEAPLLIESDRPPCITTTDPEAVPGADYVVERAGGMRRFAVLSVVDELDPYPLPPDDDEPDRGTAQFRWQIATPATGGELVELDGHALADYYLDPAGFAPGDTLSLRVEANDRVARTLPCADSAPTCSIGDDGCLQRVTWGVEIR